jgi:hypothetical protein
VIHLVGFSTKGLGCFYAQSTKKVEGASSGNVMAVIVVIKGTPTISDWRVGCRGLFEEIGSGKSKK